MKTGKLYNYEYNIESKIHKLIIDVISEGSIFVVYRL